jgi:hypothetical protein
MARGEIITCGQSIPEAGAGKAAHVLAAQSKGPHESNGIGRYSTQHSS